LGQEKKGRLSGGKGEEPLRLKIGWLQKEVNLSKKKHFGKIYWRGVGPPFQIRIVNGKQGGGGKKKEGDSDEKN